MITSFDEKFCTFHLTPVEKPNDIDVEALHLGGFIKDSFEQIDGVTEFLSI